MSAFQIQLIETRTDKDTGIAEPSGIADMDLDSDCRDPLPHPPPQPTVPEIVETEEGVPDPTEAPDDAPQDSGEGAEQGKVSNTSSMFLFLCL